MTHRALQTLLLLLLAYGSPVSAEHPPEFEAVVKVFSGLSYGDQALVKEATTPDFLLLEMGEVWDREFLLPLVKPDGSERSNYFDIISVHRYDGATLINYWNSASIVAGGEKSSLAWLESVVAVATEDGWKLQQMHSTRIEPEQIPKNVELKLLMLERSAQD